MNLKIYGNNNHMNTEIVGNVCKTLCDDTNDFVIAFDGDILVNPENMNNYHNVHEYAFICKKK